MLTSPTLLYRSAALLLGITTLTIMLQLSRYIHDGYVVGTQVSEKARSLPPHIATIDEARTHIGVPPGDYTTHKLLHGITPRRYAPLDRGFANIGSMPNSAVCIWYTDEYTIGIAYDSITGSVYLARVNSTSTPHTPAYP